jgi:hypothetical protein
LLINHLLVVADNVPRRRGSLSRTKSFQGPRPHAYNVNSTLSFSRYANVFTDGLSIDNLRQNVPAVFAAAAHESLSQKYTFIPTDRVLTGLMSAGFVPVEARQAHSRKGSPAHARHVVRLRRRFETVALRDSVPEVVFLNSHDGTSAYQLRLGLFRAVCTNGLIVSVGAFPAYCVAHRGDVVDQVVTAALEASERFEALASRVERMELRRLHRGEQIGFAGKALALRFPELDKAGIQPSRLLECRRVDDTSDNLWTVFNRVQENLLGGGLIRRTETGRLFRTRRITSIREDVRLNGRLWDLAEEVLAA